MSPVLLQRFACELNSPFPLPELLPSCPLSYSALIESNLVTQSAWGHTLFSFLFLHWQKELCFNFQRYGAARRAFLFFPRIAFPNEQRLLCSQAADLLVVFFQGILVVGVVRNTSFYFTLTPSGLIQGQDTNCSQLKPDTLG